MTESSNEFELPLRVYYEDTDAGGVVYHANYLKFMERCRCEWLQRLGFDVAQMQQDDGVMFVVRQAEIEFDEPARLFDQLVVTARALHVGKVKLVVEQKIYNLDNLLCKATIKLATLDSASFKLTAMPAALQGALAR